MVATKLGELKNQLFTFFTESGKEYFFALSTKDLGQVGKGERDKKFYCLCFNDGDSNDNHLIEFLMKRKKVDGSAAATPRGEPGECRSKIGPMNIRNLTNHYLDYHPTKLYEFLRHAALKSSDQKLKSTASKVLLSWYESEREHKENAPRFRDIDLRLFEELANIPSTSTNFGLILNQEVTEQDDNQEPELTICDDDVDEADLFRHNVNDEFVNEENDGQNQGDSPERDSGRNNDAMGGRISAEAIIHGYRSYPSTSGQFIVKNISGSHHERVSNFAKPGTSGTPQTGRIPKGSSVSQQALNVNPRNPVQAHAMSQGLPQRNVNGVSPSSHTSTGQRTPTLVRQSSKNFGLQHNNATSRPGPYVPQRKSMN
ncbi:uncharacterized protein LOC141850777 [Brevipalpus obovatus]|uniref:uncharacterized protein LOC141850777 n=1 Tax=Brevipalpus obovatus TaxID=246614 RepID=UPI003D9DBF8F